MTNELISKVEYDHVFDKETNRHYTNKTLSVLHCHHYTSLYCQLALDAGETELLKESARVACKEMLDIYFANYSDAKSMAEKAEVCTQYYALVGLGKMQINFMGADSGEIELLTSHTDAGWMKKWGTYDKAVNYITAGYIEAMFEICANAKDGSFNATETQSIVMGAETSKFSVTRS